MWDSVIVRNVHGCTRNASIIFTSRKGAKITAYYPNNQKPEFTVFTLHFVNFTSTNFPWKLQVLWRRKTAPPSDFCLVSSPFSAALLCYSLCCWLIPSPIFFKAEYYWRHCVCMHIISFRIHVDSFFNCFQ